MALPVYLLSDFGTADEFVAAVKGVIISLLPSVLILDISHDIPPFDVRKGAVVLAAALPHLPPGVCLAVVDPGVGTERRALMLRCGRGDLLLGPDNGLLLPAAERLGGVDEAWSLRMEGCGGGDPHPTFHGRDLFAPLAARLAAGMRPEEAGDKVVAADLAPPPWEEAVLAGGALYCRVIDIDRFGNLRLSAEPDALREVPKDRKVLVDLGERQLIARRLDAFGEALPGEALIYEDSSGWLGLAMREGDLAKRLGARPLQSVIIYLPEPLSRSGIPSQPD